MTYSKNLLDNKATQSTIDLNAAHAGEFNQQAIVHAAQVHRDMLSNINDPESAAKWVQAGYSDPVLGPVLSKISSPEQGIAGIPTDPQAFQQWKNQASLGAAKFIEMNAPKITSQNLGGSEQLVSTPGLGGAPTVLSSTPRTQSPDSVAGNATTRSEGALNRANHLTVAGLDANGNPKNMVTPGEQIDMSKVAPADIEAAWRYNQDGTLPPNMGRGQQGANESLRLRTIAAQINQTLGISPEDARSNQLAFKGSGQAITQLVKKEAQIGANVRNFDYNAGQVLDLSQKVDRTGVPLANAWLNAGRRAVTGNPDLAAFDTAVKTTVNEFAQIVSGATGGSTQGEKEKAEKLLSAAQTPEQIVAVVNQMRNESQNRMKSFADQKQATLASMRGRSTAPAAGATDHPADITNLLGKYGKP